MENRSHALMAGLFTLSFAIIAAVALWWFSGASEDTDTYILETRGNVTGLNVQGQVRYRGIRAGKVVDISPDANDPGLLLVKIIINGKYILTDKTVARLNYQGVTGLAYVMLEESDKEGGGKPLDTRDDAPSRIRIQPGFVEKLGEKAGDIAGQLAELSARLNRLLDERNFQNISRTLDNLATASDGLKELPNIMASLKAALSDDNLRRLQSLLAHLEKTAGEAAPLTAEVRILVTTMNGLAKRFDSVGERMNADTLPRAETLMTEVTAATRRLDRLLDTLNDAPQSVLFGKQPAQAGPGEAGFAIPKKEK